MPRKSIKSLNLLCKGTTELAFEKKLGASGRGGGNAR